MNLSDRITMNARSAATMGQMPGFRDDTGADWG